MHPQYFSTFWVEEVQKKVWMGEGGVCILLTGSNRYFRSFFFLKSTTTHVESWLSPQFSSIQGGLGLVRPLKELHPSQVIPDVIPSVFRSSYWSSYVWLPFIYFPNNAGFRFSMYVSKPAQSLGFNIIYYVSMLY